MSALTVAGILSAIPWKEIFEHGPSLMESARRLFKKSAEPSARGTLLERIERLERNEREQAKLIEQLVERQELLLKTVQVIGSRVRILFFCTLVSVLSLIACLWMLFSR